MRMPSLARHLHACVKRLRRDSRGAAVVEFAFVAPLFFTLLFTLVQGGLLYWTKETLDEVAYATARCMSVDSGCETTDEQRQFAVNRARSYGVVVSGDEVTVTSGTTCKGDTNANLVSIDHTMDSPLGALVPFLTSDLSSNACFPVVSD